MSGERSIVILSEAKELVVAEGGAGEVLRFAQDDAASPSRNPRR